jgi:protein-disulfide isomerase
VKGIGRTLGNGNAGHTMDIWVDFQCPLCREFSVNVEPMLVANAALCANDKGQFWMYHDWLFANQYDEGSGAFSKERLKTIGRSAGIRDLTTFSSCVDGDIHNGDITSEVAPASVTGTPTVFVDGAPAAGYDYATVSAALDEAIGN